MVAGCRKGKDDRSLKEYAIVLMYAFSLLFFIWDRASCHHLHEESHMFQAARLANFIFFCKLKTGCIYCTEINKIYLSTLHMTQKIHCYTPVLYRAADEFIIISVRVASKLSYIQYTYFSEYINIDN